MASFFYFRENNIVCNGNNNKFCSKKEKKVMRTEVEKMLGTVDEVIGKTQKLITLDSLKIMNSDDFEMMQLCLQLMDESKAVLMAEAEQLDRIEKKLDKLLSTTNKIGA